MNFSLTALLISKSKSCLLKKMLNQSRCKFANVLRNKNLLFFFFNFLNNNTNTTVLKPNSFIFNLTESARSRNEINSYILSYNYRTKCGIIQSCFINNINFTKAKKLLELTNRLKITYFPGQNVGYMIKL